MTRMTAPFPALCQVGVVGAPTLPNEQILGPNFGSDAVWLLEELMQYERVLSWIADGHGVER